LVSQSIILDNKPIKTINEFLNLSIGIVGSNVQEILNLDFQLDYSLLKNYLQSDRVCPIIQLATQNDAQEITQIFKEIYQGTYPYKKMESVKSVREMINDPNYHWFIFRLSPNETVGCFGTHLEFDLKRGFLYGFVIKKQYQKVVDIFKAFIGCAIYLWKTYLNRILLWYGEMRTNESTSQFFTSIVGLKPIAFLPNKDIFFKKIESDVLHVIHSDKALKENRCKEPPRIIRQILNCYSYSNKRFQLGLPIVDNPKIDLDKTKVNEIKQKIVINEENEDYGTRRIKFSYIDSDSFFEFLYNPYSKNFEKMEYNVISSEELFVFTEELKNLINGLDINYCECIISAYKPEHQQIFHDAGFKPRGYIPGWEFDNEKNIFKDCVVFNFYKGLLDKNLKIIPEGKDLLKILNIFGENPTQDIIDLI